MIRTAAVRSTTLLPRRAFLLSGLAVSGCAGGTLPPAPSLASARPPDLRFTMPDGAVLPARRWLPPGGPPNRVALMLHGMNDSRDWLDIPADLYTATGMALYAPDQRGFGQAPGRGFWPGVPALVSDAQELVRQVRALHPGVPVFLCGESMGGAVSMVACTSPGMPLVDGVVLLSPAVWGRAQLGFLLSTGLWLVAAVAPGYHATGREVPIKVVASDNRAALLALVRDPLTLRTTRFDAVRGLVDLMDAAQDAAPRLGGRVLALYGAKDMLVPEDAMATTWRKMPPGVRRGLYPRGYHLLTRDLQRAAPINDILAWTVNPGGFLPSGADFAASSWQVVHS